MTAETVSQIIRDAVSKLSPRTYVAAAVRAMDPIEVQHFAVDYLMQQVKQRQRSIALSTEREKIKLGSPADPKSEHLDWVAFEEDLLAENRRKKAVKDAIWAAYIDRSWAEFDDEKLLRSKFSRGDGTEVTWGDASREDHQYRVDMHTGNAVAGVDGAARHMLAIRVIDDTKAANLRDAVSAAHVKELSA